jgi:hypothetical protein
MLCAKVAPVLLVGCGVNDRTFLRVVRPLSFKELVRAIARVTRGTLARDLDYGSSLGIERSLLGIEQAETLTPIRLTYSAVLSYLCGRYLANAHEILRFRR